MKRVRFTEEQIIGVQPPVLDDSAFRSNPSRSAMLRAFGPVRSRIFAAQPCDPQESGLD